MIGARTVGAATRAIEESVDFATNRIQGGGPLVEPPADPGDARRHDRRHHRSADARLPGRVRDRLRRAGPQDAARQGGGGEAGGVRGRRPRRRQRGADPRRTRLHARLRRASGSTASCASTASGRAPRRSSGSSSATRSPSAASTGCWPSRVRSRPPDRTHCQKSMPAARSAASSASMRAISASVKGRDRPVRGVARNDDGATLGGQRAVGLSDDLSAAHA